MSLNWEELVVLGLTKNLNDHDSIIYLMNIIKPMRREFIHEEARMFHLSLRMTPSQRWGRLDELRDKKKFSEMNTCVPITCNLPFNGIMWRKSFALLKSIIYLREGFLRKQNVMYLNYESVYLNPKEDQTYSEKIKTINLFLDDSVRGFEFRRWTSKAEIEEAILDYILFDCEDVMPRDEYPYIISHGINENSYLSLIN